MKYARFEDLPVWRTAMDLAVGVFQLVEDRAFNMQGDLRDQLQRAALSVSNNIAEGFERGTTQELLTYLYIARGSAAEVRSMLMFTEKLKRFKHLAENVSRQKALAESCSRQLRAWAEKLQNSDIKGLRHLTEKLQQARDQQQRAIAFADRLRQMQRADGAFPMPDVASPNVDSPPPSNSP